MKRKGVIAISALSALACAATVAMYTMQIQEEASKARNDALARYGGEQLEACVATRDIAAGESISSENVTSKMWLIDLLPEEAIESYDDVAGKKATSTIVAGEVLSSKHFEGAAASINVPAGLQAVSVEVEQAQAVGGALEAGSIVDVYSSGSVETALLVSDAYVASAGNGSGSRTWVTLAVKPDQVEQIIAATQSSTLYFTLPSQVEKKEDKKDAK